MVDLTESFCYPTLVTARNYDALYQTRCTYAGASQRIWIGGVADPEHRLSPIWVTKPELVALVRVLNNLVALGTRRLSWGRADWSLSVKRFELLRCSLCLYRSLKVTYDSIGTYDFLLVIHINYMGTYMGLCWYRFRDCAEIIGRESNIFRTHPY